MAEKLFVIMEVIQEAGSSLPGQGERTYFPAGDRGREEVMHLRPERVIPASRLRYGHALPKDKWFDFVRSGFESWRLDEKSVDTVLILSPPAPADEWEKWVEEMPNVTSDWREEGALMKAWFRKMPRRERDL